MESPDHDTRREQIEKNNPEGVAYPAALSAYEQQREDNIKANELKMAELGLLHDGHRQRAVRVPQDPERAGVRGPVHPVRLGLFRQKQELRKLELLDELEDGEQRSKTKKSKKTTVPAWQPRDGLRARPPCLETTLETHESSEEEDLEEESYYEEPGDSSGDDSRDGGGGYAGSKTVATTRAKRPAKKAPIAKSKKQEPRRRAPQQPKVKKSDPVNIVENTFVIHQQGMEAVLEQVQLADAMIPSMFTAGKKVQCTPIRGSPDGPVHVTRPYGRGEGAFLPTHVGQRMLVHEDESGRRVVRLETMTSTPACDWTSAEQPPVGAWVVIESVCLEEVVVGIEGGGGRFVLANPLPEERVAHVRVPEDVWAEFDGSPSPVGLFVTCPVTGRIYPQCVVISHPRPLDGTVRVVVHGHIPLTAARLCREMDIKGADMSRCAWHDGEGYPSVHFAEEQVLMATALGGQGEHASGSTTASTTMFQQLLVWRDPGGGMFKHTRGGTIELNGSWTGLYEFALTTLSVAPMEFKVKGGSERPKRMPHSPTVPQIQRDMGDIFNLLRLMICRGDHHLVARFQTLHPCYTDWWSGNVTAENPGPAGENSNPQQTQHPGNNWDRAVPIPPRMSALQDVSLQKLPLALAPVEGPMGFALPVEDGHAVGAQQICGLYVLFNYKHHTWWVLVQTGTHLYSLSAFEVGRALDAHLRAAAAAEEPPPCGGALDAMRCPSEWVIQHPTMQRLAHQSSRLFLPGSEVEVRDGQVRLVGGSVSFPATDLRDEGGRPYAAEAAFQATVSGTLPERTFAGGEDPRLPPLRKDWRDVLFNLHCSGSNFNDMFVTRQTFDHLVADLGLYLNSSVVGELAKQQIVADRYLTTGRLKTEEERDATLRLSRSKFRKYIKDPKRKDDEGEPQPSKGGRVLLACEGGETFTFEDPTRGYWWVMNRLAVIKCGFSEGHIGRVLAGKVMSSATTLAGGVPIWIGWKTVMSMNSIMRALNVWKLSQNTIHGGDCEMDYTRLISGEGRDDAARELDAAAAALCAAASDEPGQERGGGGAASGRAAGEQEEADSLAQAVQDALKDMMVDDDAAEGV